MAMTKCLSVSNKRKHYGQKPKVNHGIEENDKETYHEIDIEIEEPYNIVGDANARQSENKEGVYNTVVEASVDYDHINVRPVPKQISSDYDTTSNFKLTESKPAIESDLYNHIIGSQAMSTDNDGGYSLTRLARPSVDNSDYSKLG